MLGELQRVRGGAPADAPDLPAGNDVLFVEEACGVVFDPPLTWAEWEKWRLDYIFRNAAEEAQVAAPVVEKKGPEQAAALLDFGDQEYTAEQERRFSRRKK